MEMPRFTAAASLYKTSRSYRRAGTLGSTIVGRVLLAKGCGPCIADPNPPDIGTFTGFTKNCCDPLGDNCVRQSCPRPPRPSPTPTPGPTEAQCYATFTFCMGGALGLLPPFDVIVAEVCKSNLNDCLNSVPDPPLPGPPS